MNTGHRPWSWWKAAGGKAAGRLAAASSALDPGTRRAASGFSCRSVSRGVLTRRRAPCTAIPVSGPPERGPRGAAASRACPGREADAGSVCTSLRPQYVQRRGKVAAGRAPFHGVHAARDHVEPITCWNEGK